MNQAVIILGAGVMQGPVIKTAKELGYFSIALDGSKAAPCISMADQFEEIDLKNKEEIESFACSIKNKYDRIGIMTAGTDFSASVAWVAEKLGLPGIPYETALNASDKSRMRECFKQAGVPSPKYITISNEQIGMSNEFLPNIFNCSLLTAHCSLVVKPVDNMGSRGCRRVDTIEELEEAAKDALRFSRSGRAIIEEYMEGSEFSVDAIVYRGEITICGLADRHIFFPPYFIEMGHTMPTQIDSAKQAALLDCFREGVRALGISDGSNIGAAKGDIKLTKNGQGVLTPMIGEIAARLSGGYMSGWTYPYSSGANPIKAAILMAMGEKPDGLVPQKNWVCAERAFISIPGTVKAISGVEEAKQRTGDRGQGTGIVNDIFIRIKEGDKVSFPTNNVTKCGNVIASAPDRETAVKLAEDTVRAIRIHLDPDNPETKEFLTQRTQSITQSALLRSDAEDNMSVELQIEEKNAEIIVRTVFKHT